VLSRNGKALLLDTVNLAKRR